MNILTTIKWTPGHSPYGRWVLATIEGIADDGGSVPRQCFAVCRKRTDAEGEHYCYPDGTAIGSRVKVLAWADMSDLPPSFGGSAAAA